MKKALLVLLMVALVLVVGAAVAAADSDQAAVIITLDEGCEWGPDDMLAGGSVHYVEANHGQWKLTCTGEIIEGSSPEKAVVVRSTADDPVSPCYTPFGETDDWQTVFAPSGESSLTCQGDLSP